jgi:hypothetical protein
VATPQIDVTTDRQCAGAFSPTTGVGRIVPSPG